MDTISWSGSPLLSDEFLPVCRWGNVTQTGMSSLPVVEHFDVFADLSNSLLPGTIFLMMDQFRLECAEEALHRSVVPTVPFATHRWQNLELLYQFPIAVRTILTRSE